MTTSDAPQQMDSTLTMRGHLDDLDVGWEEGTRPGQTVVTLPGEHKLATVVALVIRGKSLQVRAFVVRNPDENHEGVYAYLLRRNLRMPGLSYAIDTSGDVYLVGHFPVDTMSASRLDELLGGVLIACDEPFNELLALGFLSAMKTEWTWRTSRGESTANLAAFRHLLEAER